MYKQHKRSVPYPARTEIQFVRKEAVYEFQNLVGNTNTITTEKPNKSESTNIALDFNTLETKASYSTTIAVETHFTKAFSSENPTLGSMLEIYLN